MQMTNSVLVEILAPTDGELPEVVRQACVGLQFNARYFVPDPKDGWRKKDPPGYVVLVGEVYTRLVEAGRAEAGKVLCRYPVSAVTRLRFPLEVCRLVA